MVSLCWGQFQILKAFLLPQDAVVLELVLPEELGESSRIWPLKAKQDLISIVSEQNVLDVSMHLVQSGCNVVQTLVLKKAKNSTYLFLHEGERMD